MKDRSCDREAVEGTGRRWVDGARIPGERSPSASGGALTLALPWIALDDLHHHDGPRVGGKALPLGRLAADGLPVPPGFVIPVGVFQQVLREAGLLGLANIVYQRGEGEAAQKLRSALGSVPLSSTLAEALLGAFEALGGPAAVRSSAVGEDSEERSFAGQHETVLGVERAGFLQAVRACWSSLYSERALAYRRGRGPSPGAMAVLVQRMVPAEASGVMFTVNPVSGSWRELSIEAVWGLPEGLVSGQVAPHWFLLRRPRRTPRPVQRVLARVRLHLLQREIHPLSRQWVMSPTGVVEVEPVPPDRRSRPALSRHDARRLGRLGLRIEARMGGPQDIEWARTSDGALWILQARPITTATAQGREPKVLWTRRFIGERLPDPVTPLWWSILGPMLEHFIAYPQVQRRYLGGGGAVRLVHGRPYLNVTVFRHLAFKLPGHPPPRFMTELLPPAETDRLRSRLAIAPDLSVYRALLATSLSEERWRRFAWNPFTNPRTWASFEKELLRELPALTEPPEGVEAALRRADRLFELLRSYIGIHVCSLLFANLWDQIFEGLLTSVAPEEVAELRAALLVTPPGNRTLEVNQALTRLALALSGADLEALSKGGALSVEGREALQTFLDAHGHRADASWDLYAPRWREDPAVLAPILRARGREPSTLEHQARSQIETFAAARARLAQLLPDPLWRAAVLGLLDLLREYLLLRENQRYRFEQLQWALRVTLDGLGRDLSQAGLLPSPESLRYCTWSEVVQLARGGAAHPDLLMIIGGRERELERCRERSVPAFLMGDEGVPLPSSGARLQGQGVSPGRAVGRIRRVRTLADAEALQPGEILVAPAIDPAWTPLLLISGGMVLELGSRLSHGAVVAREYRLPAVVNVDGALERLVDGEEVIIDGTRGLVFLQSRSTP